MIFTLLQVEFHANLKVHSYIATTFHSITEVAVGPLRFLSMGAEAHLTRLVPTLLKTQILVHLASYLYTCIIVHL